jgi:hypothetical protein
MESPRLTPSKLGQVSAVVTAGVAIASAVMAALFLSDGGISDGAVLCLVVLFASCFVLVYLTKGMLAYRRSEKGADVKIVRRMVSGPQKQAQQPVEKKQPIRTKPSKEH